MPSPALTNYVKCYYTMTYEEKLVVEDYAFATGCIEIMFTLQGTPWQVKTTNTYKNTSNIELWGQVLKPLPFKPSGQGEVFGIRFFPATASFFLNDDVNVYNDQVFDLTSIEGDSLKDLHARLCESKSASGRVELVEKYLFRKLERRPKVSARIDLVRQVMNEVTQKDFFDNIENVAERYGITSRYLQKVFVQHTGLTPKLYIKINRFQNSLVLMGKGNMSLTSIAYTCGYFDQSHFIREFKAFTGMSPSGFQGENSTAILASPNK